MVAYSLNLPAGTKIHNVFHVSSVKNYHGDKPVSIQLPLMN